MKGEKIKTMGAGMRLTLKKRFSAKRLALMGVFVALSFAVSLLSFSIFPASPVFFLELDFGNVFILLISFLLGPIEGVIVCVLKEGLRILAGSTGGVGELANMLMTSAYILLPSIVYQYRKGLKSVAFTLMVACFIGTAAALLVNRFITFPLFLGEKGVTVFTENYVLIIAFNMIKTLSIGVLTLLLYKRLSNFLKKLKI
ncbi:MAG: ECF transporter S component [Clostridiales bacterium]|nr:ECF transporter S component [Clostridiales bacterium]